MLWEWITDFYNPFKNQLQSFSGKNQACLRFKKICNWITPVYHQTWLQKADSAVLPWTLMHLSAPPGQHHRSSWMVFVAVAGQHQVSNSGWMNLTSQLNTSCSSCGSHWHELTAETIKTIAQLTLNLTLWFNVKIFFFARTWKTHIVQHI